MTGAGYATMASNNGYNRINEYDTMRGSLLPTSIYPDFHRREYGEHEERMLSTTLKPLGS